MDIIFLAVKKVIIMTKIGSCDPFRHQPINNGGQTNIVVNTKAVGGTVKVPHRIIVEVLLRELHNKIHTFNEINIIISYPTESQFVYEKDCLQLAKEEIQLKM